MFAHHAVYIGSLINVTVHPLSDIFSFLLQQTEKKPLHLVIHLSSMTAAITEVKLIKFEPRCLGK